MTLNPNEHLSSALASNKENPDLNRREMLSRTGAAAVAFGLSRFPLGWAAAADAPKKQRPDVHAVGRDSSTAWSNAPAANCRWPRPSSPTSASKHGFDVVCEKDGRVFLSREFPRFDGFLFETQGDLTAEKCKDGSPPMPAEGKKALLQAVAGRQGLRRLPLRQRHVPLARPASKNQEPDKLDPYIAMLGGEFIRHGRQQKATMRVIDDKFPGLKDVKDFELMEEWYALKNFAPDLHVILVQETKGMVDALYQRPSFPATWARKHQKGRVFYTSMGHRDDVWKNATFQQLLLGGLSWSLGLVKADVEANLKEAAPKASELPRQSNT